MRIHQRYLENIPCFCYWQNVSMRIKISSYDILRWVEIFCIKNLFNHYLYWEFILFSVGFIDHICMRGGNYGIIRKYEISRFQLWLVLLFHRNTMSYSRRTPMMQCSKKQPLVVVLAVSTDESVFCELQEFFQISFQTLKLTSAHVIWTLVLIIFIMYILLIVVCYTLVVFSMKIFCPSI